MRVASVEGFGLLFGLVVLELPQFFVDFVLQLFEAFCTVSAGKWVLCALVKFVSLLVLEPRMDNRSFIFVETGGRLIVFAHSGHGRVVFGRQFVRKLSIETLVETVRLVVVRPFFAAQTILM